MAEHQPADDSSGAGGAPFSAFHALFDIQTFKSAGSLLGIVGASGGSLVAAAFGIGYLAVKKHDEMVGMPTTVVDHTSYVRTGALFFSNSLFHLFSTPRAFLWIIGAVTLTLIAVVAFSFLRHRAERDPDGGGRSEGAATASALSLITSRPLLLAAQVVLFIFALFLIRLQAAVFDPINKDLLYQMIETRNNLLESGGLAGVEPPKPAASLPPVLFGPSDLRRSERVQFLLRQKEGRQRLREFYGEQLALLILFFCAFVAVRLWRKRLTRLLDEESPKNGDRADTVAPGGQGARTSARAASALSGVDTLVHFFLYAMLIALAINIPATYGILVLPTDGAMVEIHTVDNEGKGILLTDMSTPSEEIWILARRKEQLQLVTFERSEIERIVLTGQRDKNFLAVQTE